MATANFVYNADKGGAVEVHITNKPLEQDGNVLGSMPLDLEDQSLKGLLEQVFAWGVSISRRNPRLYLKYPEP